MNRIFYDIQQNTDEWLELRKGLITASGFSDLVCAKSTAAYKNRIATVAYERCGVDVSSFSGNKYTEMGHEQEPLMKETYELCNLEKINNGGFFKYGEWLGASPDGLIGDDGIWENKAKTAPNTLLDAMKKHKSGFKLTEKTNKQHYWQVHFQLYVSGREWCDYQVGTSIFKPMIYRVYKDDSVLKIIEETIGETIQIIKQEIEIIKEFMI